MTKEFTQLYDLNEAKKVLEKKLDPSWIKTRTVGKTELSYIGGHTVIRLLNKAFNYGWSFVIVTEEVVPSVPKFNKWAKEGQPTHEEQPPVVKVLGRLTIPGLGIKEQYGSKVLIGGASEQESAFKSASTDALKKCASLFGIGLELYGDDEGFEDVVEETKTVSTPTTQAQTASTPVVQTTPIIQTPPISASTPTVEAVQEASNTGETPQEWEQADIDRLKDLKQILGITDNTQLDPYVREFLDHADMTYYDITPVNVKAFNIFLAKKAENL